MILISYGIPKSGSTLAFELASHIVEGAGFAQRRLPERLVAKTRVRNFIAAITASVLDDLLTEVGPDEYLVIKTHSRPQRDALTKITAAVENGRIKIHAVLRDPRETALALLDAGIEARAKGKSSAFAKILTLNDAKRELLAHWNSCKRWTSIKGTLPLLYDDVAFDTGAAVVRMARHLGLECRPEKVVKTVLSDKQRTLFNKGIPSRWINEMSPEQSREFLREFSEMFDAIQQYQSRVNAAPQGQARRKF
jgi:hypothetical protein